ncbi:MAG: folate-binding protein [Terracidiphilus sp.]
MAETGLTVNIQATALSSMQESAGTQRSLSAYRGVLTPQQFDAPSAEIAALAHGTAIHDLGWLRRVEVRGADRFRWLSGMVTNTVNDLFPNSGAWNLVLNAQGRIQGDLTVWREGEEQSPQRRSPDHDTARKSDPMLGTPFAGESGLELEIEAGQFEKLMAHLNQFIIMDDVELVPLGEESVCGAGAETAIGVTGPQTAEVLERLGLPFFANTMKSAQVGWNGLDLTVERTYGVLAPHFVFWVPCAGLSKLWSCIRTAGAIPVGCASLEAFRIAEGIPAYGIDILERDLPQETAQLRALNFNKGCYLGQEIVERIRSRGNVHRHLRHLELEGPVPEPAPGSGTELKLADGSPAGHITSASELPLEKGRRAFALAMVRAEAEAKEEALHYSSALGEGTARIHATHPVL